MVVNSLLSKYYNFKSELSFLLKSPRYLQNHILYLRTFKCITSAFLSEHKGSTRSPLLDVLERLSSIEVSLAGTGSSLDTDDAVKARVHTVREVGKHRRRNGVEEETVNTYGSVNRPHGGTHFNRAWELFNKKIVLFCSIPSIF